jgi:hypothetical protein
MNLEKVYGFHHICLKNNGYEIYEDQLELLESSGLYNASEVIFCSVLGDITNIIFPDKYKIVFHSKDFDNEETRMLEFMYNNSLKYIGKYYYIHTKGVNHHNGPSEFYVHDWRKYMEYFVVEGWKDCVKDLDNFDLAGVNYSEQNKPHFSGNFWWARSDYVSTHPPDFSAKNRYDNEMWICNSRIMKPRIKCYFTTKIDLYNNFFPRYNYLNISI